MDARIDYALAVAREGNFTRAAAAVHAAQSTVSAGVRALENELGYALFDRDTRRVSLTPRGREALPVLEGIRAGFAALGALADTAGELRGTVRVGILTNVLTRDALPRVLSRFRAEHPLVHLELAPSPEGSTGHVRALERREVDVAFLGLASDDIPRVRSTRLAVSELSALLPEDHPLAARDRVSLTDLARLDFVDSPAGFGSRRTLEQALAARGLTRRVAVEIADVGQFGMFVAAGLGVAVLPSYLASQAPGVVERPLVESVSWDFRIAIRDGAEPAAHAFHDLVVAEVVG